MSYSINADKTKISFSGSPIITTANGDGQRVLLEIKKFLDGKEAVRVPLRYVERSRCWVNGRDKVVLFNTGNNDTRTYKAFETVQNYLRGTSEKPKTDVEATPKRGLPTTDSGVLIGLDTNENVTDITAPTSALQIDKDNS